MSEKEYPTKSELNKIKNWDVTKKGIRPLAEFICDIWHWTNWAKLKEKRFELHTGGWSGNEEIINALQENNLFWSLCWQKSERGGHYYFTIKEVKRE